MLVGASPPIRLISNGWRKARTRLQGLNRKTCVHVRKSVDLLRGNSAVGFVVFREVGLGHGSVGIHDQAGATVREENWNQGEA